MLSRMADSLYWLSRYTERSENLARILDVAQRLAVLPSAYAGASNEWESAIATAACRDAFYAAYSDATRDNVIVRSGAILFRSTTSAGASVTHPRGSS